MDVAIQWRNWWGVIFSALGTLSRIRLNRWFAPSGVPRFRAVRSLGTGKHVGVVTEAAAGRQRPLYAPLAVRPQNVHRLGVEGQAVVKVGLRPLLRCAALHPGERRRESHRALVEVEVSPAEGDHLAPPRAGDGRQAEVADHVVAGRSDDGHQHVVGGRLAAGLAWLWRFDAICRVGHDQVPADGLGQRRVEDGVHPTHRGLRHPAGPPDAVEVVDVDRSQPVEGDVADVRRDVVADAGCVASGWPGERSSQPGRRCSTQRSMSWPTVMPDDGRTCWASSSTISFASSTSATLAPAFVLGSLTVRLTCWRLPVIGSRPLDGQPPRPRTEPLVACHERSPLAGL